MVVVHRVCGGPRVVHREFVAAAAGRRDASQPLLALLGYLLQSGRITRATFISPRTIVVTFPAFYSPAMVREDRKGFHPTKKKN